MQNENEIVSLIQRILGRKGQGIGDDCAIIAVRGGNGLLATTDMLVEGVDFDFRYSSLSDVGHKAVMVNLSDIAAMGGTPMDLLVTLGIPHAPRQSEIRAIYKGILGALANTRCEVVGGDLSAAPVWTISITALGKAPKTPKKRAGAGVGHVIGLCGVLGWSALGLRVLRTRSGQRHRGSPRTWDRFTSHHLRPNAQIRAGEVLGGMAAIGAMIDVSDGLSTDLSRICRASRCGAIVNESCLDLEDLFVGVCKAQKANPLELALHGGEDYGLLFTCPESAISHIAANLARTGSSIRTIGRITKPSEGLRLKTIGGAVQPLAPGGFDHFSVKRLEQSGDSL